MSPAHAADLVAAAGRSAVWIGLVASVFGIALYLAASRGRAGALRWARVALAVTAGSAFACSGALVWLVVNHQFQYKYVFDYSAADLRFPFTYAAAWAGQEGSFLLWSFWTALIGLIVAWKAGKWESRVMAVYLSVPLFLFSILVWMSPYRLLSAADAAQYGMSLPPSDGLGLNPSLMNVWMAIHPPTIFFGFSSLAVPFAYAVATLMWRDYDNWARRVTPWVLLTVGTLGVGKMMGGYWAYETLGWHGFWAWDPVENVSLLPWLSSIALLHGLVVQRQRGGMARANLLLAIVSWSLFIYGTFLTRSGVLANFSVHSFVSLENTALMLLIVMIVVQGLGALGLLAFRWRSVPVRTVAERMLSRDAALMLASALMAAACIITAIGTSWPILSQWTGWKLVGLGRLYAAQGGSVQPSFYNRAETVLLIPGLLLMGMVPFLAWGRTDRDRFIFRAVGPWMWAVLGGFAVFWFERSQSQGGFVPDTPPVVVVVVATLGLFAAVANIGLVAKIARSKPTAAGGWIAHVGFGLMFVGVVVANVYEQTENFNIVQGQPPVPTHFGYAIQFAGWTDDAAAQRVQEARTPEQAAKRQAALEALWWKTDHAVRFRLVPIRGAITDQTQTVSLDQAHAVTVNAPVFLNKQLERNAGQDDPKTMRWPYIYQLWDRDLYIAVAGDPQRAATAGATLRPGQTTKIGGMNGTKPYTLRYEKFYMSGDPGMAGTVMGAVLQITTPDGRTVTARPGMRLGGDAGPEAVNTIVPEIGGTVQLAGGISPATHAATLLFDLPGAPAVWKVPLSVTNKPLINLVWLGVLLVGLGAMLSLVRRAGEARRAEAREEMPFPEAPQSVPEPAALAADSKRRAEVVASSRSK